MASPVHLKYHITFPTVAPKNSTLNSKIDDFTFAWDDEKIPVIILFGWAACKDKHLAKYSSIYEDLGFITLRCRATVYVLSYGLPILPTVAEKFLQLLDDLSLNKHPIFFHSFSNGGAFFYQNVSSAMQKQGKTLKVKGVIFDSAPGRKRFSAVYRAFRAVIGGPIWYNVPASFIFTSSVMTYFTLWPFVKALTQLEKPQFVHITLDEELFTWPQLVIYSQNDEVIRYEDVEEFIRRREQKGVQVTRLCFGNSPHVQHLLTHREVYISTIVKFVKECLNGNSKLQSKL